MPRLLRKLRLCALGAFGAALLALPSSAFAGRLIVTGHDSELHCGSGEAQCAWLKTAIDYVRAGAPDPSKPVLLLDYDPSGQHRDFQLQTAVGLAYGSAAPEVKVVEPRAPGFAAEPLNTSAYSAVVVASDSTCGGCDLNANDQGDNNLTPDSDAINARAGDLAAFFNAGGGILALAGALHGDGDVTDGPETYYRFVPIPLGGLQVQPPFRLTPAGQAVGFEDSSNGIGTQDEINCCATHNSFAIPPAGSALQVLEYDSSTPSGAETLGATGQIDNGQIVNPPVRGVTANAVPESGRVFVKLPAPAAAKYRWAGAAASKRFIPLDKARQIPIGSTLDTRRGRVRLTLAAAIRRYQTGHFNGGLFHLEQKRTSALTTLSMMGGGLSGCDTKIPKGGAPKLTTARRRRSLFSRVHGRFRTRGRSSSATVRGTQWVQKDSCAGTLTAVKRGTVAVRDFAKRRTVVVKRGHSYFARATRRR